MANKPATFPYWATQNSNGIVQPPQSEVETGYVAGQAPVAEHENWLRSVTADWLAYLNETQATSVLASTLDPSVRLLGGGTWRWALSSTTLSWSETAFLAYPGAPDAANAIAAGSATLPAGYIAYITANEPFSTQATTASGSSTLTNVAYADQIQVGWTASGPGLPAGTTVTQLDADGTSVELSKAATATAAGVTISFGGSGALTVQTAAMASFTPAANSVIIARATDQTCYVGVGTGQMRMHDGEAKGMLEGGYLDIRRAAAGEAISARQAVYISGGGDTGRTAGQLYLADASGSVKARAYTAGLAITAHASGETAQVVNGGLVEGFTGLTAGAPYYLDPATLGGITLTRPTASGALVAPMGLAVSSTALYLKPGAGASVTQNPTAISLSGDLTCNGVYANAVLASSFTSGNGFRQQVAMGGISVGQNATINGTLGYAVTDQSTGNAVKITRQWCPGYAGSLVGVQLSATSGVSGNFTVQVNIARGAQTVGSGQYLLNTTNLFFTTGSFCGMFFPVTKGTQTFGPFDIIYMTVSSPATQGAGRTSITGDLTVEMGA